jgi:hypothetical protein
MARPQTAARGEAQGVRNPRLKLLALAGLCLLPAWAAADGLSGQSWCRWRCTRW